MKNWIKIDDKYSFDFGLKMARLPIWTAAAETVETTLLPGVPVQFDKHTGQYEDIPMELTGYLTRPYFTEELAKLNAWLLNGKTLTLSTQPHIYAEIRSVGQIVPERIGTRANAITIPITVKPFKYSVENEPIIVSQSPAHIYNPGNFYCEPVYRLTIDPEQTGVAFLIVNGITLEVLNQAIQTGTVVIDLQRKKVYMEEDGVLTIVQKYTAGRFWDQILSPGDNTITWNSRVKSVSIKRNVRWL